MCLIFIAEGFLIVNEAREFAGLMCLRLVASFSYVTKSCKSAFGYLNLGLVEVCDEWFGGLN